MLGITKAAVQNQLHLPPASKRAKVLTEAALANRSTHGRPENVILGISCRRDEFRTIRIGVSAQRGTALSAQRRPRASAFPLLAGDEGRRQHEQAASEDQSALDACWRWWRRRPRGRVVKAVEDRYLVQASRLRRRRMPLPKGVLRKRRVAERRGSGGS